MAALSFKDLAVWGKAMDVATEIYAPARLMPKCEDFRLTAQMIRAGVSIPANIAEGHARASRKDYAHFVSIARGSTAELETLLLLAIRANLLPAAAVPPLISRVEEVARMLNTLHSRLKQHTTPIPSAIPSP